MGVALVLVVLLALVFAWSNGVHDAANAVAAPVATRALQPAVAVALAAALNLLGGLVGSLVGQGIVDSITSLLVLPAGGEGLRVLGSALAGATGWNLLTWRRGLPTSSTHALAGGLLGSGLSSATTVRWQALADLVLVPLVVLPALALALSALLVVVLLRALRGTMPHRAHRRLRMAQTVSSAVMALGHGLVDAQKSTAVVVLALVAAGAWSTTTPPWWVGVAAALAMAVGTGAGGWRVVRTLAERLVPLDAPRGLVAQVVAAGVLYGTALLFHAPVSTTPSVTTALVGAGGVGRWRSVRWRTAGTVAGAWVVTVPAAALVSAAVFALLGLLAG